LEGCSSGHKIKEKLELNSPENAYEKASSLLRKKGCLSADYHLKLRKALTRRLYVPLGCSDRHWLP